MMHTSSGLQRQHSIRHTTPLIIKKRKENPMTTTQTELVQASFAKVLPIADEAAALFYGRLFELDPALRPLFKGDLSEQGRKLMQMIGMAVKWLDRWQQLAPVLGELARRHEGYGVRPQHYDTVGAALIWTLEQGLGTAFTPEVKAAWVAVYTNLANTMQAASAPTLEMEIAA
jgi:hemoglobin-like flavoprotein